MDGHQVPGRSGQFPGEPRKNHLTFHCSDSFFRDPYNGLLSSPYNWVGFHPLYFLTPKQLVFFHCSVGVKGIHTVILLMEEIQLTTWDVYKTL